MKLWKFKFRSLTVQPEKTYFWEFCLLHAKNEKDAVQEIRMNKFSQAWWENTLILEIENLGEIWYNATAK